MKSAQVENVQTAAIAVRPANEIGSALPPEEINRPVVTAAQAKIDAVANLTMKAYERAATLQITPEEAAKLAADFPDQAFKPGAAGKEHLIYIEHAFLRDRLSEVFGMGQWAIIPRNRWAEDFTTGKGTPGSRVYVEAMLVIRGCFVAEAVGAMEYYPKNESQNYGDAVEGAKTAAFRRCAKELGVGLQAWKKDWCDGWWARRRGGRDFSKGTPMAQRQQANRPAPPAMPPPGNSTPVKNVQTDKPWAPTAKTRDWVLGKIEKAGLTSLALEYFRKLQNPAVLLPTEGLKDIPLRFIPNSYDQLRFLLAAITDFGNGDEVKHAFAPNELPGVPAPGSTPAKAAAAVPPSQPVAAAPPPQLPAKKPVDNEYWRDIIVPIPNKGQKRGDYIVNPDTIGSLYDQCKSGTPEACKRLWGFVSHFEPKPWTGRDNQQHPPSDTDLQFRKALDDFKDWHDKYGKDTQVAPATVAETPDPLASADDEETPFDRL